MPKPTGNAPIDLAAVGETASGEPGWSVYIVECSDGTLYTGIAKEIGRRLREHNEGRASRYTRSRRPVKLRYRESCANRSNALIKEAAIKSLRRGEKERLIERNRDVGLKTDDLGEPTG